MPKQGGGSHGGEFVFELSPSTQPCHPPNHSHRPFTPKTQTQTTKTSAHDDTLRKHLQRYLTPLTTNYFGAALKHKSRQNDIPEGRSLADAGSPQAHHVAE
jgi:hypothetical protein